MNHRHGSSGSRSPRSPTLTPNRQLVSSPNNGNGQKNQRQQQSQQQRKSSSWWSGFWDSSAVERTPQSNSQQQPILKTPDYNDLHLEGNSGAGEIDHSLMFPQVEDESTKTGRSSYRLQPRVVPQQRMTTTTMMMDNDEEHVFPMMNSKKQPLSPLRNRSPKMPTSRPPMVVASSSANPALRNRSPKMPTTGRPLMVANQSPRSPFRYQQQQQHFPKPIAEEPKSNTATTSSGLNQILFGSAKRRAAFWTVLSVLMLGPTIFLGGGGGGNNHDVNHGIDYSDQNVFLGPYENNEGALSDHAHRALFNLYDTNTFLVQDQVLNAGESRSLSSHDGVNLRQESNGNLVLYNRNRVIWETGMNRGASATTAYMTILQADGNMVTRSMTFNIRQMAWTTNVDWSSASRSRSVTHGEYALMLTPNADGLMIVRRFDGQVIWSTAPARFDPPPLPSPTNRPTPPPVAPRPVGLSVDVFQPASLPQVVAPPSASPPGFPSTVPQSQEYSLQSGPMLGHTTHNSAKFWVFLGQSIPMQLVYWPRGDQFSAKKTTLVPDAGANNAAIKIITGLRSNTVYLYEIRINDKWLSQGQFKTAPSPDRSSSFKYVLASCMDVKSSAHRNQPVWNEIQKKNVAFAMLPGDTVYLNYLDWTRQWEVLYGRIWYRYLQQRAEANFARFIKTIPTYGTWDNHDFGTEYADRNQRGKDNSLKAWRDLWPLPYQGSSKGPGNYYSFSWGDVDFFVMDCRWYRSWGLGILFGDSQLAWLEDELVASRATFKVIVSASDVMESGMTGDLQKIGKIVSRNSIPGVLFNAGDIHRNEYKSQDIANWPYKVHQFSSSGIGVEWRRNFAIVNVNTDSSNPEIRVDFHSANSPAQSTTWSNNRNLACSSLGSSSNNRHAQCTQRVRLSDLTP